MIEEEDARRSITAKHGGRCDICDKFHPNIMRVKYPKGNGEYYDAWYRSCLHCLHRLVNEYPGRYEHGEAYQVSSR